MGDAPGSTGFLLKDRGWTETGKQDLKGKTARVYEHPIHGKLVVSNNWYEHYDKGGTKVGEKTDLVKGTPLSEKLAKYMDDKGGMSGKITPPTKPTPPPPTITKPAPVKPPPPPPEKKAKPEPPAPAVVKPGTYEKGAEEFHAATLKLLDTPGLDTAKQAIEKAQANYEAATKEYSAFTKTLYGNEGAWDKPENKAKLSELYNKQDEANDALHEAKAAQEAAKTAVRDKFNTLLRGGAPAAKIGTKAYGAFGIGNLASKSAAALGQMLPQKFVNYAKVDTCNFKQKGGRRAYYSEEGFPGGAVFINPGSGNVQTGVHEMGHWLEYKVPGLQKEATDFLNRRTAGEFAQKLKKLTGKNYKSSEVAKPDKFTNPYIGKIYPHGATEIISMGMEQLYHNPAGFAKDDPDYFKFMYSVIHKKR